MLKLCDIVKSIIESSRWVLVAQDTHIRGMVYEELLSQYEENLLKTLFYLEIYIGALNSDI